MNIWCELLLWFCILQMFPSLFSKFMHDNYLNGLFCSIENIRMMKMHANISCVFWFYMGGKREFHEWLRNVNKCNAQTKHRTKPQNRLRKCISSEPQISNKFINIGIRREMQFTCSFFNKGLILMVILSTIS